MRIIIGFLAGIAAAYAALAIYRTLPEFPDVDYQADPRVRPASAYTPQDF